MQHESASSMRGQAASTVALLQYGPCWCRGVPGDTGSFDFIRQRRVDMDLGPLGANLVIVSERVLSGSGSVVRAVFDSVADPKIVIAAAVCPSARSFWDRAPVTWIPVAEVLPVDARVASCISGEPEALLGAVLSRLSGVGSAISGPARLSEAVAR